MGSIVGHVRGTRVTVGDRLGLYPTQRVRAGVDDSVSLGDYVSLSQY